VMPATGALVPIPAVLSGADVWPLERIAILNQESNHDQVRHCHASLHRRPGPVLGCGASSLLPKQVFVLRPGGDVLCPRGELLCAGPDERRTDDTGASGGLCSAPGALGQHEPRRSLGRHVAECGRATDLQELFVRPIATDSGQLQCAAENPRPPQRINAVPR
jgi:hypothetical protein